MNKAGFDVANAINGGVERLFALGCMVGVMLRRTFELSGDVVDIGRERIKGIRCEIVGWYC